FVVFYKPFVFLGVVFLWRGGWFFFICGVFFGGGGGGLGGARQRRSFAALIPLQAPANAPSSASPVYVELGTAILFQCKRAASTVPHQSMEQTTPEGVIKVP
ncbi:hypothetical protein, partial [Pseudomonas sp. W2-17]|uniref:hypothetical protein n=1 Tax=Pseudomonas sp. W2-17 TaxID=3058039 RepID=UPI0034E06224